MDALSHVLIKGSMVPGILNLLFRGAVESGTALELAMDKIMQLEESDGNA